MEANQIVVRDEDEQRSLILDQFARQAEPFARMPAHSAADSLEMIRQALGLNADDTVLDVACGPGIVACFLAPFAQQVTGIDLTAEMIEQAKRLQSEKGLSNLAWDTGDVSALPYADGSYSVVVSRYTFHHFLKPQPVLAEMARVCKPGGKIAVIDVSPAREKREAYDHMEKLRDPSHVQALTAEELSQLGISLGLQEEARKFYRLELEMEAQLAASFPSPESVSEIRKIFTNALELDAPDIEARRSGDQIWYSCPISMILWTKAA